MKKDEVQVGGTYLAKVTDKVVPVRIDAENARGGWDATNLATGKKIRIKSAQRLRGPAPKRGGSASETPATKGKRQPLPANSREVAIVDRILDGIRTEGDPATPEKKQTAKTEKGLSCLDAAVEVLKAAGEPLQCKAMIDAMQQKGLWTSDAPTPAATLYSAILREIQKKGSESRFTKTQRGHFTLSA